MTPAPNLNLESEPGTWRTSHLKNLEPAEPRTRRTRRTWRTRRTPCSPKAPKSEMFSTEDTIVAIATPPGRGGIGVIRLSGSAAAAIAGRLTRRSGFDARHATLAAIVDAGGETIDRAIVT